MRRYLPIRTLTAADLASADEDSTGDTDFTVIATAGVDSDLNLFFLDKYVKKGADPVEILREVIRQMTVYHCSDGLIEKNRFETLMRTCNKLVKAGFYGPYHEIIKVTRRIRLIPHYTNKKQRFADAVPQVVAAHQLWLQSDWMDFKEFFMLYPAVEHDDIGDVVEMIASNAKPPSVTADTLVTAGELVDRSRPARARSTNEALANKHYDMWTGTLRDNGKNR